MTPPILTSYHDRLFEVDSLRDLVAGAARALRAFNRTDPFEVLAFCGASGAALAWPLSLEMGVPLAMVRKKGDEGHGAYPLEGARDFKRYVIVDDFIQRGDTFRHIVRVVRNCVPYAEIAGLLLHAEVPFVGDVRKKVGSVPIITRRLRDGDPLCLGWGVNRVDKRTSIDEIPL